MGSVLSENQQVKIGLKAVWFLINSKFKRIRVSATCGGSPFERLKYDSHRKTVCFRLDRAQQSRDTAAEQLDMFKSLFAKVLGS